MLNRTPWPARPVMAALWISTWAVAGPAELDDLRGCADVRLQAGLERELGKLGLGPAVEQHHLAVALVDLSANAAPRLAMVNGDDMIYAASLPKIAILLGAFVQAERGELELDKETLASLHRMIRNSSNVDASRMLSKVGEETLLDILTSERYRFYDPSTGGGLWVGKPYGKAPAYHRDPLQGLSHGATAFQVARFYFLLDRGLLLSPDLTRQMKAALAEPGIHHKFVKGLALRPDTRLYRKSGTWRHFHSDSALVEAPRKRYILVGIAVDPRGGEWLEHIAAPLHDLIQGG
ncbi:MAG TPA: serine hydrolase [Vicinamibacteria bacterium]|nr:serine hydrolase [Vicinamibacteria bacterium]